MSLNDTPSGERLRISFFGKRNAGKSSLVNAVTNQQLAVVSDTLGTTTDPVSKAMELLPLGPVLITDTPGFDDSGTLGELRVKRTKQILNKTDIAILVTDATREMDVSEEELLRIFEEKSIPFIIAKNKSDLLDSLGTGSQATEKKEEAAGAPEAGPLEIGKNDEIEGTRTNTIFVSATEKTGIQELKEMIGHIVPSGDNGLKLVGDIIEPGQTIVLVIPIDKAAPKGRLILPQQQAIRDILDTGAFAITTRETELAELLERMSNAGQKPDLVITDSQVFEKVNKIVPQDVALTSFSILMARYKGFLDTAVKGAGAIDSLQDGDRVLISEGCTHHRQCGDIGTVKLPNWLAQRTQKSLVIETSSGADFPENLEDYKLIIHCGGCMLSYREMIYRMKCAEDAGIPFTNYGIAIAFMKGILDRTISPIFKTGDGSLS
ncbi:[FeFe] hydrogenase H-cluster maturation GTPase HydF [Lachnospiraceae bacterium NE2001]|nr:[FeFe] hydrogenase H-cluster maturation GTPase HydF [Lachnospiraceae bacterium NE2001]